MSSRQKSSDTVAEERLLNDLSSLQNTSLAGLSGAPREGDIFTWDCAVCGLSESFFEFDFFKLKLSFSINYPFRPPTVKFMSSIFHPNISPSGHFSLEDLWTPASDVVELLINIQCLLSEPDPSSVVNHEAARLYREDRREYARRVDRVIDRSLDTEETLGKISQFFQ